MRVKIGKGVKAFGASWSFRHMANWRRNRLYDAVNRQMGYEELNVLSPEAISYD